MAPKRKSSGDSSLSPPASKRVREDLPQKDPKKAKEDETVYANIPQALPNNQPLADNYANIPQSLPNNQPLADNYANIPGLRMGLGPDTLGAPEEGGDDVEAPYASLPEKRFFAGSVASAEFEKLTKDLDSLQTSIDTEKTKGVLSRIHAHMQDQIDSLAKKDGLELMEVIREMARIKQEYRDALRRTTRNQEGIPKKEGKQMEESLERYFAAAQANIISANNSNNPGERFNAELHQNADMRNLKEGEITASNGVSFTKSTNNGNTVFKMESRDPSKGETLRTFAEKEEAMMEMITSMKAKGHKTFDLTTNKRETELAFVSACDRCGISPKAANVTYTGPEYTSVKDAMRDAFQPAKLRDKAARPSPIERYNLSEKMVKVTDAISERDVQKSKAKKEAKQEQKRAKTAEKKQAKAVTKTERLKLKDEAKQLGVELTKVEKATHPTKTGQDKLLREKIEEKQEEKEAKHKGKAPSPSGP